MPDLPTSPLPATPSSLCHLPPLPLALRAAALALPPAPTSSAAATPTSGAAAAPTSAAPSLPRPNLRRPLAHPKLPAPPPLAQPLAPPLPLTLAPSITPNFQRPNFRRKRAQSSPAASGRSIPSAEEVQTGAIDPSASRPS
nr:proline-rich protein 36 [Aegilops tauschii subsp. strangulata]